MTTRTIRFRLALAFALTFVTMGGLLLVLNYVLIEQRLSRNSRADISERFEELGINLNPDGQIPEEGPLPRPLFNEPVTSDGRTLREVLAEIEASIRADALNSLLIQGLVAVLAVAAVAALAGWWMSSRALRPVAEITNTARTFSEEDLSARVGLEGPDDEIKELADTFDSMLDRMEAGYKQYRNFAGVASHELRTPLAVMRVEADNALDDPLVSEQHRLMALHVHDQVDKSERMIEQLLALTRSSAGLTETTEFDLADAVGEVMGELSQLATANHIRLELDLNDAPVLGDRTLVSVLVRNLVDNAIVHNAELGWASVSVEATPEWARLTVANSGRHYSAEDVQRIMQPFERIADERIRGAGLGLATASAVAVAHGGEIYAEPLAEGGLKVTARLPRPTA